MRKVLSSLIVLAILVGMFVCLGAQAFAAQEDIAIFAVTDEQLSSDAIARLQEQCTGSGDRCQRLRRGPGAAGL